MSRSYGKAYELWPWPKVKDFFIRLKVVIISTKLEGKKKIYFASSNNKFH
jgi:hypothetical protein